MSVFNRYEIRRLSAGIMGIILLVSILFSVFYIAAEADHDCCGDNCSVCFCIHVFVRLLQRFCQGSAVRFVVSFFSVQALLPALISFSVMQTTPVTEKIRLNN